MPTHAERRHLPYSVEKVYQVVADVRRYPEFLPWCSACRITRQSGRTFWSEMTISFKVYRETFTSKVTLSPYDQIDVEYVDGPFRYLKNEWTFEPDGKGGCYINFYIDFEFKSRMLQKLIGIVFNEAVQRMTRAFERRAHELYGGQQSSRNSSRGQGSQHAPATANS